jgi:hypothetical protein
MRLFGTKGRPSESHPGAPVMVKKAGAGLSLCLTAFFLLFSGCMPGEKLDDVYTSNIYPGAAGAYTVGSEELPYSTGYFVTLAMDELSVDEFSLNVPVYTSVEVPATSLLLIGTHQPAWKPFNGVLDLVFSDQAAEEDEEEAYFIVGLPHGYVEGSSISFHVHYVHTWDTVGEEVRWGLEYTWANLDADFPASSTIYALGVSTNNDADWHRLATFPNISGTGKKVGGVLACRLFRNSSDGLDTYAYDVELLGIDLVCQVDAIGSTGKYVK